MSLFINITILVNFNYHVYIIYKMPVKRVHVCMPEFHFLFGWQCRFISQCYTQLFQYKSFRSYTNHFKICKILIKPLNLRTGYTSEKTMKACACDNVRCDQCGYPQEYWTCWDT